MLRQHFDRHVAPKASVTCAVHFPHASRAEWSDDLVWAGVCPESVASGQSTSLQRSLAPANTGKKLRGELCARGGNWSGKPHRAWLRDRSFPPVEQRMSRRDKRTNAAATFLALAMAIASPGTKAARAADDFGAIQHEIGARHDTGVKRLQDWIAMPS